MIFVEIFFELSCHLPLSAQYGSIGPKAKCERNVLLCMKAWSCHVKSGDLNTFHTTIRVHKISFFQIERWDLIDLYCASKGQFILRPSAHRPRPHIDNFVKFKIKLILIFPANSVCEYINARELVLNWHYLCATFRAKLEKIEIAYYYTSVFHSPIRKGSVKRQCKARLHCE